MPDSTHLVAIRAAYSRWLMDTTRRLDSDLANSVMRTMVEPEFIGRIPIRKDILIYYPPKMSMHIDVIIRS